MARIIKGGLINSNSNNDEPYYQKNKKSSQDTSDEQETLLQQGIRNIAKVPSLAYKHLRSGLGIGSLIKAGAPSVDSKELEEYEQAGLLRKLFDPRLEKVHSEKIRRLALPSYEEAGEEAAAVLPKYFNESKSGDAFPEFILSELPFWAASGGFRSIPAFLEAISRSAAMAGGGVAGSHAGSAIGEQLGNKELAMKMLKSKLYELELQKRNEERDKLNATKKKIEWGSQIRSYVLHPYKLIKDHRTDYEVGNVQPVLDGELDGFIKAYLMMEAENN